MPKEIERKFLVDASALPANFRTLSLQSFTQGYVVIGPVSVRVRYEGQPRVPFNVRLTIKGPGTISRSEYEFEPAYEDRVKAVEMLHDLGGSNILKKRRYAVPWSRNGGPPKEGCEVLYWEVDEFSEPAGLCGLFLAEIELQDEAEAFVRPPWVTEEVTTDSRWTNAQLAMNGRPK